MIKRAILVLLSSLLLYGVLSFYAEERSDYHDIDISSIKITEHKVCLLCHIEQDSPALRPLNLPADASEEGDVSDTSVAACPSSEEESLDIFSLACLHCHNGLNSELNIVPNTVQGCSDLAINKFHPLFVVYNTKKASLKPPHTSLKGTWYKALTINELLVNERVVCTSCHNPHTGKLRVLEETGYLCHGCHNK